MLFDLYRALPWAVLLGLWIVALGMWAERKIKKGDFNAGTQGK